MKAIQFNDKNAQRVYDEYIRRCQRRMRILSEKDEKDCLLEINSHIYEFIEANSGNNEMETLLNILERLGAPEETLKEVVALKKTKEAIRTLHPKHIAQSIFLNIGNGIFYIILSFLAVTVVLSPVMIILKLIYPENVGCFYGEKYFFFGYSSSAPNVNEVLGNWFIPVITAIGTALYFLVIFLLKLKNKNK